MKVRAFAAYEAKDFDGMEWEDILQIIPMGNKAIVLVREQEGRKNVPETSKNCVYRALMETYEDEFDKRCKEALYDDFGGTEKIKFDYLASDTRCIDNVLIVYVEDGKRMRARLNLRNRPEVWKYIAFQRKEDEL